jgi:hypothetical protein
LLEILVLNLVRPIPAAARNGTASAVNQFSSIFFQRQSDFRVVSATEQTRKSHRDKTFPQVAHFLEARLSPHRLNELQEKAEYYLQRASEAVNPQDQKLWLGLARECMNLASGSRDRSQFAVPLAPTG